MRALILLTAVVGLMALALVWKFQGPSPSPAPADAAPAIEKSGRVLVGLDASAPASASVTRPAASAASDPAGTSARPAASDPARTEPRTVGTPRTAPGASDAGSEDHPMRASAQEAAATGPGRAAPASSGTGGERRVLPTSDSLTHTVVRGDTLYSLLKRAYGRVGDELLFAVADANGMDDPGSLEVGQVLVLPVVAGYPAPEPPR